MSRTILVVAAHPDDEALGCGGTMARHAAEGDSVYVLFMTNGVDARQSVSNNDAGVRSEAAEKACELLGAKEYIYNDFPDNRLDTVALLDITQSIEKVISRIQPEIIYTHHIGDLNIDHRRTHEAVLTACRPQPNFCVKQIYAFEVLSATDWNTSDSNYFLPNYFVGVTAFFKKKLDSLKAYSSEMRDEPHSRSLKNSERLSELRGACVGIENAEAFMLIRCINKV
tara:strand:- start:30176 stop:30853 length:678 start_codon:yes stop_codon:yes gene_type:complete